MIETDILIIGGGSGGFGAAIRAARADPGARILLLDSMAQLGGTSTVGGVNVWQAGISGPGVHYELYARLAPDAIGVGKIVHLSSKEEPYGFSRIDPHSSYESSLRTAGLTKPETRRVHFEPDVLAEAMDTMLREAGVEIRYGTRFADVSVQGRRIVSVTAQPLDGTRPYTVRSKLFVDCSGGCHLARAAECGMAFGEEPHDRYQEPSAPDSASPIVNGISQVFRVTPAAEAGVDDLPAAARAPAIQEWLATHRPAAHVVEYPNGDLCVNVLPTMEGAEFHSMPYPQAQAIGQARMHAHWRRMQTDYGLIAIVSRACFRWWASANRTGWWAVMCCVSRMCAPVCCASRGGRRSLPWPTIHWIRMARAMSEAPISSIWSSPMASPMPVCCPRSMTI